MGKLDPGIQTQFGNDLIVIRHSLFLKAGKGSWTITGWSGWSWNGTHFPAIYSNCLSLFRLSFHGSIIQTCGVCTGAKHLTFID